MQNLNLKGIYISEDFLLNYNNYNLTAEDAIFLLQLSYISNQGQEIFDIKKYSSILKIEESLLIRNLDNLYKKGLLQITATNKLIFLKFNQSNQYYKLGELLSTVEKITNRVLTSKDIDIISSWFDKFSKKEILEAFNISKNINYVNGILNNKPLEVKNKLDEDDILNYDWVDR